MFKYHYNLNGLPFYTYVSCLKFSPPQMSHKQPCSMFVVKSIAAGAWQWGNNLSCMSAGEYIIYGGADLHGVKKKMHHNAVPCLKM